MSTLIERETRLEAWIAGVEHLLPREHDFNVILSISDPASDHLAGSGVRDRVDQFLVGEGAYPLQTVAETIFPAVEYRKYGPAGVFTTYPEEVYPAIKQRWGTYAYRLVRRTTATGTQINPLEELIKKMRVNDTKRSWFEIGIAEGAYDLPLYDTVEDRKALMGAPCLSHVSFKKYEGRVFLTAMYRSHDYRHKVLGNLLGLARLQQFVADQTDLRVGPLVVHSTYATLEGSLAPVKQLLAHIADIREQEESDGLA